MKQSDARIRIERLRKEIDEHNYNYYVLNNPVISDFEFDLLINELETLEKTFPSLISKNSPTQRVGSDISNEFRQYEHRYPMMSLANTYNEDEIRDFNNKVLKAAGLPASYVCELKFDGASISLTYRNNKLFKALTRGDGTRGDDVTLNVKTIKSIPDTISDTNIPDEFIIRGEILMPKRYLKGLTMKEKRLVFFLLQTPVMQHPEHLNSLIPELWQHENLIAFFISFLPTTCHMPRIMKTL
jgi:DNA ligase (NAD+)